MTTLEYIKLKRLGLSFVVCLSLITMLSVDHSVWSTVVLASDSPALPCPANLAGKFVGDPEFQWYKFFGEHSFTDADSLTLSFAIVPSNSGSTLVALDEIDGRTGYQFSFAGGLVNGSVPYVGGEWNIVKIEFDFAAKQYILAVNGISSPPTSFMYSDSVSVQALRVHFNGASPGVFAWFDSLSIVKSGASGQVILLNATFDTAAVYSVSPGSITPLEPPAEYGTPLMCSSTVSLGVNPINLQFSAVAGGSSPSSKSISITDNGVVPLSWTASESIDWLSLSSVEGITPAEVEVSVDSTTVDPGVYTGEITVSSQAAELGSPQIVYVSLTVYPPGTPIDEPCPEGHAMNSTGEWYEYFGEHTLAVTDVLQFDFSVVPSASGETLVALDEVGGRTGFQLYFFNGIVYDANHGDDFASDTPLAAYNEGEWNTVRAEYVFATQQYTLSVNGIVTGSLPFAFNDSNSVQALRFHSATPAWLDTLSIGREDITPLIYQNTFDGGAQPGNYTLPSVCTLPEATFYVSPTTLYFSALEGDSTSDTQSISITSTSSLSWIASESIGWLNLSQLTGSTPSTIVVSIDISGLDAGAYSGPILIHSDGAQNSPQTVMAHLVVEPAGEEPSAHITLSAESGYDNIFLDWNPTNNPNVVAYRVWRAIEGSEAFVAIATTENTFYLDNDPSLVTNTTYCYYVSAMLFNETIVRESNVDCAVFGRVELWIPDTWAPTDQTRIVPVNIRNATGLHIAAADIWLNFDSTVIEFLDVTETPLTSDYSWAYTVTSTGVYSQVRISAIEATPSTLYGEGALFWLNFRVIGTEGEESPLDLQEFFEGVGGSTIYTPFDLFDPVPLQLQDGVFHVAGGSVLGDLNENQVVEAVDAYIALQIANGQMVPTVEQQLTGDINGNGRIDAGDASMILHYALHGDWAAPPAVYSSPPSDEKMTSGPIRLSIDDVRGAPGDIVQTTLWAENLVDWAGGEFFVAYDTKVISYVVDVQVAGLASEFAMQYHDDGTGLLRIAFASDESISGSGALARLSFLISPTALGVQNTPLALVAANLNDVAGRDFATSALQWTIVRQNGELQVGFSYYLPLVSRQRKYETAKIEI